MFTEGFRDFQRTLAKRITQESEGENGRGSPLANAIHNDPRFVAMLTTSALNENLAKQTQAFTQIVKENAEKIKQGTTKLSIIAELIRSQAKA